MKPDSMVPPRAFEDFTVGLRFRSARPLTVTADQIWSFAADFDPQAFHLDEAAARRTACGGLVASGWHVAALGMRLIVDSDLGLSGQGAGVGVESMRWRRPVRPGDTLRVEGTVTEARVSRSRPDSGIVTFQALVVNQRHEVVQEATHIVMLPRGGGREAGR